MDKSIDEGGALLSQQPIQLRHWRETTQLQVLILRQPPPRDTAGMIARRERSIADKKHRCSAVERMRMFEFTILPLPSPLLPSSSTYVRQQENNVWHGRSGSGTGQERHGRGKRGQQRTRRYPHNDVRAQSVICGRGENAAVSCPCRRCECVWMGWDGAAAVATARDSTAVSFAHPQLLLQ